MALDSMTNPIASVGLLTLSEQGKFRLTDPLTQTCGSGHGTRKSPRAGGVTFRSFGTGSCGIHE
jgi:CubicO group peptidase (beta-lactamase class C family)